MGLLFNSQYPKRVPASALSRSDIVEIAKNIGFPSSEARTKFEELLNRAHLDEDITRERAHGILQEMILDNKISEDKAKETAVKLGLERYDFRNFKDISESK